MLFSQAHHGHDGEEVDTKKDQGQKEERRSDEKGKEEETCPMVCAT